MIINEQRHFESVINNISIDLNIFINTTLYNIDYEDGKILFIREKEVFTPEEKYELEKFLAKYLNPQVNYNSANLISRFKITDNIISAYLK